MKWNNPVDVVKRVAGELSEERRCAFCLAFIPLNKGCIKFNHKFYCNHSHLGYYQAQKRREFREQQDYPKDEEVDDDYPYISR